MKTNKIFRFFYIFLVLGKHPLLDYYVELSKTLLWLLQLVFQARLHFFYQYLPLQLHDIIIKNYSNAHPTKKPLSRLSVTPNLLQFHLHQIITKRSRMPHIPKLRRTNTIHRPLI